MKIEVVGDNDIVGELLVLDQLFRLQNFTQFFADLLVLNIARISAPAVTLKSGAPLLRTRFGSCWTLIVALTLWARQEIFKCGAIRMLCLFVEGNFPKGCEVALEKRGNVAVAFFSLLVGLLPT